MTHSRVTFSGLPHNDLIARMCERELIKLKRYAPRLVGCSVLVTRTNNRHRTGRRHEVRIHAHSPRILVSVTRTPREHSEAETLELAVREAFDRARRRLQDAVRRLRGAIKAK